MPLIWKETLAPGVYLTPTGVFAPTADDIDGYVATGNAMVKAGLQIPIPEEHQDGAVPMSAEEWAAQKKANSVRFNRGFVRGFRKNHRGNAETLLDIPDRNTFRRLTTEIQFVSPEIRRRLDRTGRDWGRCITHVALTPMPIWHEQKPFSEADVVPGGDGFSLEPVGKPVKLPGAPVRLSMYASEEPIRLSLAQLVVPQGDEWFVTRLAWQQAQSKSGGVKAVDTESGKKLYGKPAERALAKQAAAAQGQQAAAPAAKPKAAPKPGLREGKIGPGLKVSTPKVAPKGPAKPRAPKAAAMPGAAKVAKPSGPVKGLSPEEEAALDKTAAEKQALRELPVTKGATGDAGKGYSRKLGKLDVPAFDALAKRIDPDTDLVLNGQAFANARRAYSTWTKKFPNPAEFAEKIEAAWKLDEEQVAKGKKKNAEGTSYAARALAFRHMLQWADEDWRKGKETGGSPEEASAREYKARLEKPREERLEELTTSVDAKGERKADPQKAQKYLDQLGLALLKHDSPYLKLDAKSKSNLERIVNKGSQSKEDTDALAAMTKAALDNYRKHGDEAYPVKSVRSVLENLSNTGAGTLNPDELRGLLRDREKSRSAGGAESNQAPKEHIASTKALYEQAANKDFNWDDLDAHVADLNKKLTKDQTVDLAHAMNIPGRFTSKADAIKEIRDKIAFRRNTLDRVEVSSASRPRADLQQDRAKGKTQLSAARLSHGDTTMADEDKDNDELFTDDEIGDDEEGSEETPTETVADDSPDEMLAKASEAAKVLGIVVEESKNAKDWIAHFVTAALTHKATKDKENGAEEEPKVDDSMAMQETPQVGVAMSAVDLAKALSDERLESRKRLIHALVKKGKATPAQGKAWLEVLEPKRLSLASSYPDSDVAKALAQIDMAKSIPAGTFMADGDVQLSAAQPAKPPEYAVDTEAAKGLDLNVVNRLSGGKYADYAAKKKTAAK